MSITLPGPLTLLVGAMCVWTSTSIHFVPLFTVALAKLLVPLQAWRRFTGRLLASIAESWISVNSFLMTTFTETVWDVEGIEELRDDRSYLVVSNHQSWVDIPVLQHVFNRRIPLLRFFLKQQLIYVPLLGFAWWALDFPFMKRYSREKLRRHPELRGKDLETTRRTCRKFRQTPVSIMNFLEGTRFTAGKHGQTRSPFAHLLPPKAGGLAFVLSAMGEQMDALLDVTIVYPDGEATFSRLFRNAIPRIRVIVTRREIPPEMIQGDYSSDPEFKKRFQDWVMDLWRQKDDLIGRNLPARPH